MKGNKGGVEIAGAVAGVMSTFCVSKTSWLLSIPGEVGADDDHLNMVQPRRETFEAMRRGERRQ
jgi:hypothetical protein